MSNTANARQYFANALNISLLPLRLCLLFCLCFPSIGGWKLFRNSILSKTALGMTPMKKKHRRYFECCKCLIFSVSLVRSK